MNFLPLQSFIMMHGIKHWQSLHDLVSIFSSILPRQIQILLSNTSVYNFYLKEKPETTLNYNIRLPTGAQSAMECRTTRENCFQHDLVQRSESMLEYSGVRYMTKFKLDSYNDTVYKDSVKKFIDPSKKVAYTHKLNEEVKGKVLKEKKPKKSGISSSYVTFKEKDMVEWNKYAQIRVPKKIADEREHDEKFEFKDKEKYKIYLELCEVRDSLVKIPQSKIERNKKLDPIFTKRYKQFVFAKSCNRAPEFDQGDTNEFLKNVEKKKKIVLRFSSEFRLVLESDFELKLGLDSHPQWGHIHK
ncbi:hypothetical protein BpHYR1_021354 [Brachionus plicatilis]|uniref:Uncharacterized protein n=1 Tax=Brachionus plicatilis TaxID=10195 RepID=A0A3M7Q8R1_BRAPC|nr:hypothetical protein BpHYR1_021354 [Brachionus plicatilis]